MAIPQNALVWPEPMDPGDIVDYAVDCTTILDSDETLASFTLVPLSESTLLGLTIGTGTRAPAIIAPNKIRIWLSVASNYQANPAYDGAGTSLPIELTIDTTSSPSRRKQRTLVVKVVQR